MPTITIDPDLYKRIESIARREHASLPQMLETALRRYIWELDRRKISEEAAAYRHQHATLKKNYLGEYIAMRDGEVVDHDRDFHALRQRVRQKFQHIPVMITLVGDSPEQIISRRGFRVEKSTK